MAHCYLQQLVVPDSVTTLAVSSLDLSATKKGGRVPFNPETWTTAECPLKSHTLMGCGETQSHKTDMLRLYHATWFTHWTTCLPSQASHGKKKMWSWTSSSFHRRRDNILSINHADQLQQLNVHEHLKWLKKNQQTSPPKKNKNIYHCCSSSLKQYVLAIEIGMGSIFINSNHVY